MMTEKEPKLNGKEMPPKREFEPVPGAVVSAILPEEKDRINYMFVGFEMGKDGKPIVNERGRRVAILHGITKETRDQEYKVDEELIGNALPVHDPEKTSTFEFVEDDTKEFPEIDDGEGLKKDKE